MTDKRHRAVAIAALAQRRAVKIWLLEKVTRDLFALALYFYIHLYSPVGRSIHDNNII